MAGGVKVVGTPFDPTQFAGFVDKALEAIGKQGVIRMKANMKHSDYQGRLRGSVMWRTGNNNSEPDESEDMIDAPMADMAVNVGSAAPNAAFIEYGTSPHSSPVGHEEFVQAIIEWANKRGIPDDEVYPIIKHIQEHGTNAFPYLQQTIVDMKEYCKQEGIKAFASLISNRREMGGRTVGFNEGGGE